MYYRFEIVNQTKQLASVEKTVSSSDIDCQLLRKLPKMIPRSCIIFTSNTQQNGARLKKNPISIEYKTKCVCFYTFSFKNEYNTILYLTIQFYPISTTDRTKSMIMLKYRVDKWVLVVLSKKLTVYSYMICV
jgi:hypothetical protein